MKKILYKKDSKGKIRVWEIYTLGDTIIQLSGLLDGKLVTNSKKCTSKNVGRSNETSPENQAILEMQSGINSKLDEGYFYTIEEAKNEEVILPMLAKNYNDEKHKIDWENCYVQPKLDGQRVLAIKKNGKVKLLSRDGKEITTLKHIIEQLENSNIPDNIYDGEAYNIELGSFQEQMKAIKTINENTCKVNYNIYDIVINKPFSERLNILKRNQINMNNLKLLETNIIVSEKELNQYHKKFLSQGYEGSIIRHGNKPYEVDKRSDSLLKYKSFQDIAAIIIDILPSEADPKKGVPVLRYNNVTFEAGTAFSHADREDLLTNKEKYINKIGEIRFFEYTDSGKPRFPVLHGIRLDK